MVRRVHRHRRRMRWSMFSQLGSSTWQANPAASRPGQLIDRSPRPVAVSSSSRRLGAAAFQPIARSRPASSASRSSSVAPLGPCGPALRLVSSVNWRRAHRLASTAASHPPRRSGRDPVDRPRRRPSTRLNRSRLDRRRRLTHRFSAIATAALLSCIGLLSQLWAPNAQRVPAD